MLPRLGRLNYARKSTQLAFRRRLSQKHVEILGQKYPIDEVTNVTPAILSKVPLRLHTQPAHPLSTLRGLIEEHFADFSHVSSFSPVVTPFKNFDELSFAKDHPGRAVTDSYYVNKDMMLRTHTSAHEVEMFRKGETKWLLTADVYRRDEIDASHYPVFHQVEGARIFDATPNGLKEVQEDNERLSYQLSKSNILIEDVPHVSPTNPVQEGHDPVFSELVAKNLKLSLNGMILKLFGGEASQAPLRVRWIEAYFPFTSPSFEVEVFYQGKWLEILGSGVVVRATLDTAGASFKRLPRCLHLMFLQVSRTRLVGHSVWDSSALPWSCFPSPTFDSSGVRTSASSLNSRQARSRHSSRTPSTLRATRMSAFGFQPTPTCTRMTFATSSATLPVIWWKMSRR